MPSRCFEFPSWCDRHEADPDPLFQDRSNPIQHRKGVPFVVCVFQPADDGGCRSYQLSQLALGQTSLPDCAMLGKCEWLRRWELKLFEVVAICDHPGFCL